MKIYTRTGDKGQTSLFGGKRVSKASLRVKAYGSMDELNSMLGVVIAEISNIPDIIGIPNGNDHRGKYPISNIQKELERIQQDLFTLGAVLANPTAKPLPYLTKRVEMFEKQIDRLTAQLPELHNFILPGGSKAGTFLHLARTICRKAERHIVSLAQEEQVDERVIKYINRLSDLLFTMARYVNKREKKQEIVWKKQ